MLARVSENRQPPGSALCIPRLREGRLFETAAARHPQDEELSQFYQRLPHAEERPLRDAACGGSSGQAGASRSTHRRDAANFLTASKDGTHIADDVALSEGARSQKAIKFSCLRINRSR